MKKRITTLMMAVLFIFGGIATSFADQPKDEENGNPNFTYIDDFEEGVANWWDPEGSGSTAGIVLEDDEGNLITYREHETEIVNPHTGSTGSMKLQITWNDEEYEGTASHLVRQHMPAGTANTPERQFQPGQALEVFMYGDGSGNRFRFMTRDGIPTLEGSTWYTIDWVGWKRITWDYNNPDNVVGWVNGDGEMDGINFYFDSFQITKDAQGTTTGATLYFDDLRIVDPFNVHFNIADADGSEVISIANVTYPEGHTEFQLFPGEYQFFVEKEGFITYAGTFEVDEEDIEVDVTLTPGDDPEYLVTFQVMDAEGIDMIDDATITIEGETFDAGQYEFDLTPGFYNYTVSKELYFDYEGTFTVIDGNVFVVVMLEEIPDVYDRVVLSWDVASTANTPGFREEHYSVWVAVLEEADQAFDPEDFEMVFQETLSQDAPNWQYQHRSVEISAYQQELIRVAFRHHDVTDMDRIVIDNVMIEAFDSEGVDHLLHEDFEGGVPADFDPDDEEHDIDDEWLPDGWLAIDNDGDDFNWYFAIRVDQTGMYAAHMRSQSWDSANQVPLTPDNWLVTPVIEMPMVIFYTVTFDVKDEDGAALADAVVTLNGQSFEAGHYVFSLTNGMYEYEVNLEGYEPATGTFEVAGESFTEEVVLELMAMYDVTFSLDMRQYGDFEPGVSEIYITGTFPGWDFSMPGTIEDQLMDPTDNVFFLTKTLSLPAGTYEYKYFDGPSYDNGEWPGDPNRVVVVEGDMLVEDIFGVQVSVIEEAIASVSLFPNPANNRVTIQSDQMIHEVAIYNIAGQQVYSRSINAENHMIELGGFNNGIYMVRVQTAQGVNTYKLQIVK